MKRTTEYIKEFNNGNLNIKLDKPAIETISKRGYDVYFLTDLFSWLDTYFIGETYCISNYETGHTLYNLYSDLVYVFPWSCLETLKQGKTVKLYAHKPDSWEREEINRYFEC